MKEKVGQEENMGKTKNNSGVGWSLSVGDSIVVEDYSELPKMLWSLVSFLFQNQDQVMIYSSGL